MREAPRPKVVPETSSGPPNIPEKQETLFREVLTLLEQKRISYAVAGAFALREHTGIFRDTKDLDVFLTSENAARALQYLRQDGFQCEIRDPVWFFQAD